MASVEIKNNGGVRRHTPTSVVGVIVVLSFAMLGCSGETATAGTVRVVKSFDADYHITSLAWHPNSKELATGASLNARVTTWDTTTGKKLRLLDKQSGGSNKLAYSPDGRYLAVGRNFVNNTVEKAHVHLYDVATGNLLNSYVPPPDPKKQQQSVDVEGLAFSPDSQYLIANGYGGNASGAIYRIPAGEVVCMFTDNDNLPRPHKIYSLAYSPDGRMFAVGRINGTLELWSAGDCKQVKEVKKVDDVAINALSFTTDGKYLASASYGAGELVRQGKPSGSDPIQVRDVSTFEKVKGFYSVLYGAMRSLHYAHGDKYLLAGGGGKSIEIWNVENGRLIDTIQGFSNVVHVTPSPDGKYFATVSGKEIKIWEFIR